MHWFTELDMAWASQADTYKPFPGDTSTAVAHRDQGVRSWTADNQQMHQRNPQQAHKEGLEGWDGPPASQTQPLWMLTGSNRQKTWWGSSAPPTASYRTTTWGCGSTTAWVPQTDFGTDLRSTRWGRGSWRLAIEDTALLGSRVALHLALFCNLSHLIPERGFSVNETCSWRVGAETYMKNLIKKVPVPFPWQTQTAHRNGNTQELSLWWNCK